MTDEEYMRIAIEEAKKAQDKEVPVGALIIYGRKIIAKACNRRESKSDPTAHAEILALQKASKKLKSWRLEGATIYVTKEPCPMCAGAIQQARVSRLVYGTEDKKGGACGSLYNIVQDRRLNHRLEVRKGVLEKECKKLLQDFFKKRR